MRSRGLSLGRRPANAERFAAGSYLTDGRRLFRVVSQFGAGEAHARLEDCLTLEIGAYAPGELCAMGLRQVSADAAS